MTADNFTLSGTQTFEAIRFWNLQSIESDYRGRISWFIYADAGGVPGSTPLYSGLATPTRIYQRSVWNGLRSEYQNDFDVDFTLEAGTYWLALFIGDVGDYASGSEAFSWESTAPTTSNSPPWIQVTVPSPYAPDWFGNEMEVAFQLYGPAPTTVPEPTTMSLMASGLLALGAATRRRWMRK